VVSSSQLNLTWSDNSANETGFKIERALAAAGPWTQIGTTGAGVRSYASTGLSAATTYYYRVRAYNTAGNSGYTNTASATTQTILPAPLPSGSLVWARAYGAGTADRGTAVALDGSGHVLVTGHFRGTVDFGGGGLSAFYPQGLLPTQYSDIFVAKYAATAGHQWSKRFGAQSDDSGEALAVDGSGNVVVTGWLASAVDLGCGVLPTLGGFDLFVAKYAGSDGHCLWAKRFGGSQDGYGVSVIVSSTGDVFVAGLFGTYLGGSGETATFGGGTLTSPTGFSIVLAKYAGATGAHQWSKSFPTGYYANGYTVPPVRLALAVDSTGNVVLTGYFAGSVDFGGGPLVSAGDTDIFLAKYAGTNGAHLWSKRVGSTGTDRGTGVALDSRDNVVVTGSFVGTVDFGGGALRTPRVGNDVFVAKYSASGAHVWSKRFGGTNGDSGTAVAVDSLDDLTVTGGFQGTVDFGGGALSSAGSMDIFVAKYTAGGSHLWSKRFGGTGDDRSLGVAMDDFDGSVVVTGYFPGTVDFGSGPLTSAGDTAIFLLKLAP
jgi:hypothetical protein